jgi:hypothetical protein
LLSSSVLRHHLQRVIAPARDGRAAAGPSGSEVPRHRRAHPSGVMPAPCSPVRVAPKDIGGRRQGRQASSTKEGSLLAVLGIDASASCPVGPAMGTHTRSRTQVWEL